MQSEEEEGKEDEENVIVNEFRISPLATVEQLTTTHSSEYVNRFLTGDQTESEQRNVGFPWSPSGVNRALSSVGGTVAAALAVCDALVVRQGEQRKQKEESTTIQHTAVKDDGGDGNKILTNAQHQQHHQQQIQQREELPIWSAHVAGGTHHAFYDYGEGFCVFSDIAVAANVILQKYPTLIQRVLIVDLDVHQGNGNAVLFQGRQGKEKDNRQCSYIYHVHGNIYIVIFFSTGTDGSLTFLIFYSPTLLRCFNIFHALQCELLFSKRRIGFGCRITCRLYR